MTEQCNITLNMIHPCIMNSKPLVSEAMEGTYSVDATHMAPVGTKILMLLKPM